MSEKTIEIPLRKATYEELQQVICELQVERYIKNKEIEQLKEILGDKRKMSEDYLELAIKYILELIKKYGVVETSNKKYSFGLVDIKESTILGKTYKIFINEEFKGYDIEEKKE